MHLLSEPSVAKILRNLTQEQCNDFVNVLSRALETVSSETSIPESQRLVHQPLRNSIVTRDQNMSLFMPSSNTANTGIKIVTAPTTGGIVGVINVFSADGQVLGILSAAELTAFRTALATMTLFVLCTSLKKEHVLIFGSGRQAEWHARLALLLVPGQIKKITFINRGRERLEALERGCVAELRSLLPDITVSTLAQEGTPDYDVRLRSELGSCDVIFSCTPSTQPNFPYSYLAQSGPGKSRFISLIGSYKPHMREIDTETLLSGGKIYVDSKEACMEESGELIAAGVREDQLIEIGDLFRGKGDTVPHGNVVFKCVGMGVMDLVVAKKMLDVASQHGEGIHIDGFQG